VRVRLVTQAEVEAFDPEHLSFMNINTPAQLAEVARRFPR
jgi:molybdopterin-guanine dinucleotide biosynthesis protein A